MSDVLFPKHVVADELRRRQYRREYMGQAPYALLGTDDVPATSSRRPVGAPPGTRPPTPEERKELEKRAQEQKNQTGGTGPRREIRK